MGNIITKGDPSDYLGSLIVLVGIAVFMGLIEIKPKMEIGIVLLIVGVATVFGANKFWKVAKKILKKIGLGKKK